LHHSRDWWDARLIPEPPLTRWEQVKKFLRWEGWSVGRSLPEPRLRKRMEVVSDIEQ